MKLKLFTATSAFLLSLWVTFGASSVQALINIPSFPSCPNPGGTLKVSYASGIHGIPGDVSTHSGSDSVYTINSDQLVQCFCTESSTSGIQTNWWKITLLGQEEISTLGNLGWVFVPDGLAWGLEPVAYMAQNIANSCSNGGGNGGFSEPGPGSAPACTDTKPNAPTLLSAVKNGSTATLTWTSVNNATHYTIFYGTTPGDWKYSVLNTGKVTSFTIGALDPSKQYYFEVRAVNNCAPSDAPSGIGGGQVLGASTYAPTGNSSTIILIAALGLIFVGLSLLAKKHEASQA